MPSSSSFLLALVRLMRPHQWLKNAFVFAGLVFSQNWQDMALDWHVLHAFAAFCCLSSMVYIINDWHDRASDALHPGKRHRPLASGAVPVPVALVLAGLLLVAGLLLAAGNRTLLALLAAYVLLNLAYSWRLKQVPVVDVSIIASGFMLRLLAGTVAVGIPPSRWLLLTGIFVALFLGFAKRKAESFHEEASQRAVLAHYPSALLDTFMAVTMTATLTTYSLFATSPEAQLQHGERLLYTVPVVIFGMLRYTYQVHRGHGEDVARDMLRDPWILGAGALWLAIFLSRWL
ncbi:decaprenyl-phosphate phosphoribosyltransferase [Polaromonas sp. JS666]|uniref:decaprenyl-phosphate phosphoribosyltransferase n=1 Tax=Polaromonas sp. (strain JS666 / ATCC BAA-500) TaxID=296591 RepID=UPI0008910C4F|nr:decaprenyl-phosphate phosphoribosyltransferase [Polaromonas sp. JS666]SDN01166.1 4-hydroxybenzoate polyprenyltransferase [Polaromonas sp. JS666]